VYLIGDPRPIASDYRLREYIDGRQGVHEAIHGYIQMWSAQQRMREDFNFGDSAQT